MSVDIRQIGDMKIKVVSEDNSISYKDVISDQDAFYSISPVGFINHLGYFLDRWLFPRYYAILTIRTKVHFPLFIEVRN